MEKHPRCYCRLFILRRNKSIGSSIHSSVVNFIKKETKIITESVLENNKVYPTEYRHYSFENSDREVSMAMKTEIDNSNKLVRLLSFKAWKVAPEDYLYLHEQIGHELDSRMQQLLIEKLAYHNYYEYIWKHMVTETTTINDLQEIVDIIFNTLQTENNSEIGGLRCILAIEDTVESTTLKSILIDLTCFSFPISKDEVTQVLKMYNSIKSSNITISDFQGFSRSFYNWIVLAVHSNIQNNYISEHRDRIKMTPGCISYIASHQNKAQFSETFFQIMGKGDIKEFNLNDDDFLKVIYGEVFLPEKLFFLFVCQDFDKKNHQRRTLKALTELVASKRMDHLLTELINDHHYLLDDQTILSSLDCCKLGNDQMYTVLQSLCSLKNKNRHFELFSKIWTFLRKDKDRKSDNLFFHKAVMTMKDSPLFDRILRQKIDIDRNEMHSIFSHYKHLINGSNLSSKSILEISRNIMIRNNLLDENMIAFLFKESLKSVQKHPSKSPQKKKVNFQNTIRAFGQLISDLNEEDVIFTINCINKVIITSNDEITRNEKNTSYVLEYLLQQTLTFIERKTSHLDIKSIINRLDIQEQLKNKLIFNIQVRYDPFYSVQCLKIFKDNKSVLNRNVMNSLENGILSTRKLTTIHKLNLFREFRKELSLNGYKSKMLIRNFILLAELIIKSTENNNIEHRKAMLNIMLYAEKYNIPRYIIHRRLNHIRKS